MRFLRISLISYYNENNVIEDYENLILYRSKIDTIIRIYLFTFFHDWSIIAFTTISYMAFEVDSLSIEDGVKQLIALKKKGLISDEEFNSTEELLVKSEMKLPND